MAILQNVKYSKGQFKIQQMVFVLVATIIFFAVVAVFYVSIRFGSLRSDVEDQRKEAVLEQVRKIASTPEFIWTNWEDCSACVDMDKVFLLKNRTAYQGFWNEIALLKMSRVYPRYGTEECAANSYPRCNSITLKREEGFESYEAFISLCRYDESASHVICELGKVIMGFEGVDGG